MNTSRILVLAHEVDSDANLERSVQDISKAQSIEQQEWNSQKDGRIERCVYGKPEHVDQNLQGLDPFVVGDRYRCAVRFCGIPRHADDITAIGAKLLQ